MSGDIFQPMENQDDPDQPATRNPLLCYLCNEPYEDPCLLGCFHSFCARCLRGRSSDGKMLCPLCSYSHTLKDGASLPPSDLLLKFMVEASTEEKAQCANCDCTSVQMFFCNTCMQPLCAQCRQETHRAKMFSSHDMVLLTKRAHEVHKKCKIHEEPYIMFSSEKKIMLCINCFRDMRIESRGHCLDLETAYKQSCKKLDLKVQAFRELQNSVREGILLFRGLVEEIKTNADKERNAIQDLHADLMKRLDETRHILLQKVDSQYNEKEVTFRSQLKALSALVPTLHTHLVISSAFSGSANKFEFLDMSYVLMERLKSIVQKQHPLHATLSGQIDTGFKSEYFKSIEPLLYVPVQRPALNTAAACAASGVAAVSTGTSCPGSPVTCKITPTHCRRANGLNGAKVKFIDAKGQFAEHCREFENAHRDLLQRFEQMKAQCQELQRDLTMRRCLARKDEVLRLGEKIEDVQTSLDKHYSTLEIKLPLLEKHWEESLDRIVNEQDLYQAQLQDVMRLKQESQHLRVITSQLVSFVSSIAAVTERLAPKLGQSSQQSDQENQMASLMDEINAVQPDSQLRVDAIRDAEEERQTQLANRTNPLDDELIKTKGLLRCPSLRNNKGERRKQKQTKEDPPSANSASPGERDGSTASADQSSPSTCPGSAGKSVTDLSPSSCSQETATADADDRETEIASDKVIEVTLPSPPLPQNAASSTSVEASYNLLPAVEIPTSCPDLDAKCDTAGVLPLDSKNASASQNNQDNLVENGTCGLEGSNSKQETCDSSMPEVGSYISLAAVDTGEAGRPKPARTSLSAAREPVENGEHREKCSTASPPLAQNSGVEKSSGHRDSQTVQKTSAASWFATEGSVADVAAIKELLKDVENFNRKESLTSPRMPANDARDV